MRYPLVIASFLLQILYYGQNHAFYIKRQNLADVSNIYGYFGYYYDNKFTLSNDGHFIVGYELDNFHNSTWDKSTRYIKVDTLGNIKWQKLCMSRWLFGAEDGFFVGSNSYDYPYDNALNFYDDQLNIRKKVIYEIDSFSYFTAQYSPFSSIEAVNGKTFFKYLCYKGALKDERIFLTGTIDSSGNIFSQRNEPFIYSWDSLHCDINRYFVTSSFIGNYNNGAYFLNYGNRNNGGGCGFEFSFGYISWFDSASNKYNYFDIKVDSLTSIGGMVRTSNSTVLIYGSRKFQPYVFSMNLDGTLNWAKAMLFPYLQDGIYGNLMFANCKKIGGDKLAFNMGILAGGEMATSCITFADTSGTILKTGYFNFYQSGYYPFCSIQNKPYSLLYACDKIQITKIFDIDSNYCIAKTDPLQTTITSIVPKFNFVQLSPTTSVSLTYTFLPTSTFSPNTDTLVKIINCIPSCYIPPTTPPAISSGTVFPNPTTNYITVNVNTPYEFKLYSADGKTLMDQKDVNYKKIDLSIYPNGIYFIIISSYGEHYKEKIIKKE
jgi:hypothetical protein